MATEREDLIGQKLVIGIPGTTLTPEIVQQFKDTHAGGVIFYRINFESPNQLKKLIADLENALDRKLLVCVDHEGGRVVMYRDGVTIFPDNLAFGHTEDPSAAEQAGRIAARELRALGTDVNFAPVLDVLTEAYSPNIGIRSYGKDWKKVADFGGAFIKGLQMGGISATAKHFPGKGHAPVDAHLKLPIIQSTWEDMQATHLQPFLHVIQGGIDCIMTSHPYYPRLDPAPTNIATFSRRIVHDFLREELSFKGVIVSDDLEMGAIKEICPVETAGVRTVAAGHDLVLSCHDFLSQRKIFQGLKDAYQARALPYDELEESVDRIVRLKAKRNKRFEGEIGPAPGGPDLAQKICREAVHVIQDPLAQLPLAPGRRENVAILFPQLSYFAPKIMVEKEFEDEREYFRNLLNSDSGHHETLVYPMDPEELNAPFLDGIIHAKKLSQSATTTIFFCFDAHLYPSEQKIFSALHQATRNLIVVLMRDPYDIAYLHPTDTALTCFGWRKCQIEAVINRIYGQS